MNARRGAALLLGIGLVASLAGHLLTYQLLFGGAALRVQSVGAHAYFPGFAKIAIGLIAVAMLAALCLIALARIASGRRLEVESAPSYLRLLAALFTLQLAIFVFQETAEAAIAGVPARSFADLVLWGALGQLPVAALAALAGRWLLARLRPAARQLGLLAVPTHPQLELTPALVAIRIASGQAPLVSRYRAASLNWRGPPSF